MSNEKIGKGIVWQIENGEECSLKDSQYKPFTADYIGKLFDNIPNSLKDRKMDMWIGANGLRSLYNSLGRESFIQMLHHTNINTGTEGIEFINSLNIK